VFSYPLPFLQVYIVLIFLHFFCRCCFLLVFAILTVNADPPHSLPPLIRLSSSAPSVLTPPVYLSHCVLFPLYSTYGPPPPFTQPPSIFCHYLLVRCALLHSPSRFSDTHLVIRPSEKLCRSVVCCSFCSFPAHFVPHAGLLLACCDLCLPSIV